MRAPTELAGLEGEAVDVAEVIYRHFFQHNASGAQSNAAFFAISYSGDGETTDARVAVLVSRFEDHTPAVVDAASLIKGVEGVKSPQIEGNGLLFYIAALEQDSSGRWIANAGYYEASSSSSGNLVVVERVDGEWKVTSDEMQWIS